MTAIPRYDSMSALLADPNNPLRAYMPPPQEKIDAADLAYLVAYLKLRPQFTLEQLLFQGLRERVSVHRRKDLDQITRMSRLAYAAWNEHRGLGAPVQPAQKAHPDEEPAGAGSSPPRQPAGVSPERANDSRLVLSGPPSPLPDFWCVDEHGEQLGVQLPTPTLEDAFRERCAWIRPGTQRELVDGTMAECPTPELLKVAEMLREKSRDLKNPRRLVDWRRYRCALLVLEAREPEPDVFLDTPPMVFTAAEITTMSAAVRRVET